METAVMTDFANENQYQPSVTLHLSVSLQQLFWNGFSSKRIDLGNLRLNEKGILQVCNFFDLR